MEYITFRTAMGWVGILASEKGLMAASLPRSTEKQARLELGEGMEQAVCSPRRFADLSTRFKAYFSGERVEFPDEIDLSGATPFQGEVWRTARLISYGEMRSYLWIAERIGKPGAARAVGQALGKNPLLIIIPCHRVVASNGGLGGFSGGLQVKRRLLEMENAAVIARA